jgi:hypothetical protein
MRTAVCTGSIVCLLTLGCAMEIQPVRLEPHLSAISDKGSTERPRLGVGVFVDRRAALDRIETHPPLRLRGLELARRGDVRTGNESFVGGVAAGIRADSVATLARSGAFSLVRAVQIDDAAAKRGKIPEDLDLVLTAKIEEFGAVQYQDSGLHLWRVGWFRSRFDAPLGFVRVRFRLYESSGRSSVHTIEAEHVSEGRPITEAALDAMAVANESLARRLYADRTPESARLYRVVPVRILNACSLTEERVSMLMRHVSEVFEREAGVRLDASVETWRDVPPRAGLAGMLTALRERVTTSDGIVLGLVPRRHLRVTSFSVEPFGLAAPFGQHAVVRCEADKSIPMVTLIHELAHLFGAVHVRERRTVMHPVAGFDGRFFDALNRRILRATRDRPFDAPLPPKTTRQLRAIYTAASRYPEACDMKDLGAAIPAVD